MRPRTLCGLFVLILVFVFLGTKLLPQRKSGKVVAPLPVASSPAVLPDPARRNLPPSQQELWSRHAPEPAFGQFADWTARYLAATPQASAAMEADGVVLARMRLSAMAELIQSNPQRALELAVPSSVSDRMPAAVKALLEQPVNSTGDLEVLAFRPMQGSEAGLTPVLRYAVIDGERYQAFTFGKGLEFITKTAVPLNGIRVPTGVAARPPAANGLEPAPFLLALSPSPARLLDAAEIAYLEQSRRQAQQPEPVCSISGQSWTAQGEATAVQLGGNTWTFCGHVHAEDWAAQAIAASGLQGEAFFQPASEGTAASSYTEGRKRMFCMRPYWADYAPVLSTNEAITRFVAFSNYMVQLSYGKLTFAPLGRGSDISADLLLPGGVASYDNTGLGKLYNTCRDVARTNYGYDLTKYDFFYVMTGARPAANYCGVAFVGGVGFHIPCWGADVSAHEFGHNLGLNHAHFWDTGAQSTIGSGQNVEYGDNNDPMGGGGNPNQYNSRYKNYLGWIPDSDVADLNALGSGTYRLYAFDLDYSTTGLRGLKFVRNASQNYWLDFRQRKAAKTALLNGVQLLWTGNGNQGSYLLDARLKGDADDNAIVVGRTFSDPALGLNVTPVGKGHTYPESIDVVVRTGPQPGNLPPVASLIASPPDPAVGQSVNFVVTATDPNGDALAYYWEFGDGADNYSFDNSPTQNHIFSAAGEYAVRCVVSDMRGGTSQQTLIVRVGDPAVFRISGHVVDTKSRPLAGVQVSAGATTVYSADDGSYTIPGLAAGSYTLSAIEPVSGSLSFAHPYFNNPVTVGPDFTAADFVGVPGSLNLYTPIVAKGASGWKYLDNGSNQGTGWRAPGFVDSGWSNGVAPLGYPSGAPITTVVGYGGNANNKYITTYFRKSFTVPNPAVYTNFLLEVLRDDGVVVYLNGVEVFRNNLPTNTITFSTLAIDTVEPDSYLQKTISSSMVVAGANVLAAEVHQVEPTSSDIGLDVAFSGLSVSNATGFTIVSLNSPGEGAHFTSPTNITLGASVSAPGTVSRVDFYADGSKIGESFGAPYTTDWLSPPDGTHLLGAVAAVGSSSVTSPPVRIFVESPVPPPLSLALVPAGSVWRYLSQASAAPANWAQPGFSDLTWSNGPAQLGDGDGDEATVIDIGPAGARYPTVYFRRSFNVNDPGAVTNLTLELKRDDGAVVYWNGVELLRDNMPAGPIAYSTLAASTAVDDGSAFFTFNLNPALLRFGTNLLAVEVHQSALTSSDLSFDLSLTGLATTNRSRGCWLVTPAEGATLALPGEVTLEAQTVVGGTLGLSRVNYYDDGVLIGAATQPPYALAWASVPSGEHTLTAVAIDSAGGAIVSAPVDVTILPPPAGTALISFGDIWKYMDEGVDLGTAWTAPSYNDYAWSSGPSRLGYGGDGELTTVSYGTNANARHVTTYFRKAFTVVNPAAWTGLFLQLVRDDGAVVYLNGVELYRNNLLDGLVSWNSLATAAVDGAAETTPIEVLLDTASLVAGENVLAVEIHQVAANSIDLGFNLALTGLADTNTDNGVYLASPANGTHFNSPANVSLAAFADAPSPVTLVEYFAGATKVGQSTVAPYNVTWGNPPVGTHALTAVATYDAGLTLTSPPVSITVGYPPPPAVPIFTTYIPANAAWSYWDNAAVVGVGWQGRSFDASSWPIAPSRFGFGLDGEATLLTAGRVSYYFRRWINVANPFVLTELIFQLQRDDGAVVYLNGVEIYRSNMPGGTITPSTLASTTVNTPDETTFFETVIPVTAQNLITGSNLVAVELHQAAANSSDAGFNMQLIGMGTTGPRVYFTSPVDGSTFLSTATVSLDGTGYAGTGQSIAKVEIFADSVKLAETNAVPFHFDWVMPGAGPHTMLARLTDARGYTVDSSPLSIAIVRQAITSTLIPSNSVWKYLSTSASQGTGWAARTYNDSAWPSGQARLGAGGDGEATLIDIGPATARYPTVYFRKSFVVPPGAIYTNLLFKLARDDGAVVYLNGHEEYRDNMPGGVITYATLSANNTPDEQTFFPTNVATTYLLPGTNVVAVEVHQTSATSSDLGFNLELTANGYLDDTSRPMISIELADGMIELSWPATYTSWRVYSSTDLLLPIGQWTPVAATPVIAGGRIVVSIPPSGLTQSFRLGRP